jgi:hypothetical protein
LRRLKYFSRAISTEIHITSLTAKVLLVRQSLLVRRFAG